MNGRASKKKEAQQNSRKKGQSQETRTVWVMQDKGAKTQEGNERCNVTKKHWKGHISTMHGLPGTRNEETTRHEPDKSATNRNRMSMFEQSFETVPVEGGDSLIHNFV